MRKLVGFLMAFAFAMFSLPAFAHYVTLVMTAGAPGTGTLTAKISNTSPSGPYTINSLKLPFGTNVGGVASAAVSAYTPAPAGPFPAVSVSGGNIVIPSGINLAKNQSITLTLSGVTSSPPSCASTSTKWTVKAYEDSNYGGYLYQLAPSGNVLTASVNGACTLTYAAGAGGTISGTTPQTVTYGGSGTSVTAVPNPGYNFVNWSDSVATASRTDTNVTASKSVTASFVQIIYTISGSTSAGGTVTCSPATATYGQYSDCSVAINPGYTFTGFSANCASTGANSCRVNNVQSSQTVTASFSQIPYAINGSTSAGGTVTCSPSSVTYGQYSDCSVAVNANFTFTGFSANCASTGATSCRVSNVQSSQTVTASFVANNLTIASPQTSAAVGAVFPVTVSLTGADATVTLTPLNCPNIIAGSLTASGTAAVPAAFGLTFDAVSSTCTLKATASNYNDSGSLPVTVFALGSLACGPVNALPGAPNTINASAPGANSINDPGFAEGVRGQNAVNKDGSNGAPCVEVNWTFTNNVLPNATPIYDAKGNLIPVNGVSFVWDQALQPNAAYSYTVTWQPEWFGLASTVNRKTQFCADAAPNACNIIVNAQACTSAALLRSSIPSGDPACVSAEVWAVVAPGLCTGSPGAGQNACVIFTTTITDIKDPPFVRN